MPLIFKKVLKLMILIDHLCYISKKMQLYRTALINLLGWASNAKKYQVVIIIRLVTPSCVIVCRIG